MSTWSQTDRRIGMCSSISLVAIVVVYVITGLIGVVERPPNSGTLQEVDPYLAILEYLIILAAVALVVMMSAVYAYAPADGKIYGRAALGFIIVFATLTCSLHFVALTAGRQLDSNAAPQLLRQLSFGTKWPSLALALELLAWDFFFGLAMLFAARVFRGGRLQNYVRTYMAVTGSLCVLAALGPVTGDMRIPWLGIAGYAFILPVVCVLLTVLFARTPGEARQEVGVPILGNPEK